MATGSVGSLRELLSRLLDRGYDSAVSSVLGAIASGSTEGVVARRLTELEQEAARLAAAGERLDVDNPVLVALLTDLEPVLRADAAEMDAIVAELQARGIDASGTLARTMALPGVDDSTLAAVGVRWNVADPEAVARLVNYAESAAWADEVARFPGVVLETVRNQAIRGFVAGWGPRRTAERIIEVTRGMPVSYANTLMRTMFLQSYRAGTAAQMVANADVIEGQIRVAALDDRTCLACIALHGTEMEVGERVLDHHNGRCTSVAVVRGRARVVRTGEAWFRSLPAERQQSIAGPGAYEVLRDGRARLADFVERYDDAVFGEMLREAALKRAL